MTLRHVAQVGAITMFWVAVLTGRAFQMYLPDGFGESSG